MTSIHISPLPCIGGTPTRQLASNTESPWVTVNPSGRRDGHSPPPQCEYALGDSAQIVQ